MIEAFAAFVKAMLLPPLEIIAAGFEATLKANLKPVGYAPGILYFATGSLSGLVVGYVFWGGDVE